MLGRSVGQLLALLLCGLPVACGDSLSPENASGTYVLTHIGGEALPAVLTDNEDFTVRVLADTIVLRMAGTGSISSVRDVEAHRAGSPPRDTTHWVQEIEYRVDNEAIEISYVCGPLALCAPPPHLIAHQSGNGLVVENGGRTLSYAKIAIDP